MSSGVAVTVRRETLRADDLDDVARDDVFLRLEHVREKLFLRNVRLERQVRRIRRHGHGPFFQRLFEQRDEPIDFPGRVFVSLRRSDAVLDDRVDENGNRLRDAIENEQFIRDQEIHRGRAEFVVRRQRHDRFDVVNEFVADEAHGAASEAWQSRHSDGAEALQHALDDFESIAHAILALLVGLRRDGELLDHFAVLDEFDALARLLDDRARIAADERVAPQMFAAFH